jgi:glutamate-5-semialdehyde dehydrogenase
MNVRRLAEQARAAAPVLAKASTARKDAALRAMASELRRASRAVLRANAADLRAVAGAGRTAAFIERMTLTPARVEAVAAALESVARLPDPVGRVTPFARRPNGLVIRKMRVPLGVVAVIYESRPGVTADAAGLCLKSGNAALLRGGKETVRSNAAIAAALRAGLRRAGLPPGSVGFLDDPDRAGLAHRPGHPPRRAGIDHGGAAGVPDSGLGA